MSPIPLIFRTRDKLIKEEECKGIKYKKRQIYKRNCLAYIQAYNLLKVRREMEKKGMYIKIR